MKTTMTAWTTSLMVALLLAGCASAPGPLPAPLDTMPAAWRAPATPPADTAPRADGARWWQAFGDPVLAELVERAADANTGLQQAAARLAQARALAREADAARRPQLGAQASLARGERRAFGEPPASSGALGLAASYEIDLFGRNAGAASAAALEADARQAQLAATRLVVRAEVAQAYFALRALDDERAIVGQTLAAYRDSLRLLERRQAAGDVAELEVVRLRAEAAATEAEGLALVRRRAALEHAIALLTGQPPQALAIAPAPWQAALPGVPAGLPADLLVRRPDVRAAQDRLAAAQRRVGIAETAWFPSLALTAEGGAATTDLSSLLQGSARAWSVGALLQLPLFDGGRRDVLLAGERAGFDAAVGDWRERLLVALREVEDELAALHSLAAESDAQAQALAAAERATVLSDVRWRNGLVSQLELLDARRSELRARRAALQLKAERFRSTVALVRALGGGWSA